MEILFRKLICDIDGTTIQQSASTSSPAMRDSAFGWMTVVDGDGKVLDICPECRQRGEKLQSLVQRTQYRQQASAE